MESARTYKKGTRVRLLADDTHKSWIAKGLANLTWTTPLVLYSKCSGRQTRNTISSQYLIHQLHHRFLFFFSISTNLARTNALRSYRRRMSEVWRTLKAAVAAARAKRSLLHRCRCFRRLERQAERSTTCTQDSRRSGLPRPTLRTWSARSKRTLKSD